MDFSSLQHALHQGETELAQLRQAVAEAAQEEARGDMARALEALELETERARRENEREAAVAIKRARGDMETAIQQVESAAAAEIERARAEMEQALWQREQEALEAASVTLGEARTRWSEKEAQLQESLRQMQTLASDELKKQHDKLTSYYEALLRENAAAAEAEEERGQRELSEQLKEARRETEDVAAELWSEARARCGAAADDQIAQTLAMADEHCSAKDEEVATLREEQAALQERADEKEARLQESDRDLKKIESAMEDAALDAHNRHEYEVSKLLEEVASMNGVLQEVQSENDSLRVELTQCRSECETLKVKCCEQREAAQTFAVEKQRFSACKQLLEREIQELVANSESLRQKLGKLVKESEKVTRKNCELEKENVDLDRKNSVMKKKNTNAIARANSLETLKCELEDRVKQKDALLAETLATINARAKSKSTPVVVRLPSDANARLSSECETLRSRVLALETERFKLEQDLATANQRGQTSEASEKSSEDRSEIARLRKESNGLKTILSMMRKEMEANATCNPEGETPALLLLEQQLLQCRSYLDLFLTARDSIDGHSGGDEIVFLRSKYRELNRVVGDLRVENLHHKFRKTHGGNLPSSGRGNPTTRERELVQRLEEAHTEIDALLAENETLLTLSNEMRFKFQEAQGQFSPSTELASPPHTKNQLESREDDLLAAILNDRQSCDSERQDNAEVACVGRKPPLSLVSRGSRPATASDRATASQQQSFRRLIHRKKKEVAKERTHLRNWNVKDPTTNPYL